MLNRGVQAIGSEPQGVQEIALPGTVLAHKKIETSKRYGALRDAHVVAKANSA
jgi:hypothetical protein